jgi:hypothetical protein
MRVSLASSQRVTHSDIQEGRIRFPRSAKRYFPNERCLVSVTLRGLQVEAARYNPRTGPDRERSAVLLVGKANLERLVRSDEILSVSCGDGVVHLD